MKTFLRQLAPMAGVAVPLMLALVLAPGHALAENADRNAETIVTFDGQALKDMVKGITDVAGSVQVSKGTLSITSDRMTITQNPDGFHTYLLTCTGAATCKFRQRQDPATDLWVHGEGQAIEYVEKTGLLTIRDRARVRREQKQRTIEEAQGALITYDSQNDVYAMKPVPQGGAAARSMIVLRPSAQ
jgi:lipopolysaccharide export system protein LptA